MQTPSGFSLSDQIIRWIGWFLVAAIFFYIIEPQLFWDYPYALRVDEPVFSNRATEIAARRQWEPGWYGHPGTVVIYLQSVGIAISMILKGQTELLLSGDFSYAQAPADTNLVGRIMIAAFALGIMFYLYRISRMFSGRMVAFAAVLLLISLSIYAGAVARYRTDIPQTFFMMMCFYHALRDDRGAFGWHRVLAAMAVALAMLCKWPGVLCAVLIVYASGFRLLSKQTTLLTEVRNLALSGVISIATAFVIAPRIFLEFKSLTLVQVARQNGVHLSHTSEGFSWAVWEYLTLIQSQITWLGILLVIPGLAMLFLPRYQKYGGAALIVVFYIVFISLLSKWWVRWTIPVYPFLFVLMALGLHGIGDTVQRLLERRRSTKKLTSFAPLLLIGLLAGGFLTVNIVRLNPELEATRNGDTRIDATRWVETNIPPKTRILLEKYTVELVPNVYDLWFVHKRREGLYKPKQRPEARFFTSGRASISQMGMDKNILARLCEEKIEYVIANHVQTARYINEGGFEDLVSVYAAFQKSATEIARFDPADPSQPKSGPYIVVYDTQAFCELDNVRPVPGELPELNCCEIATDDEDGEDFG